MPINQKLNLYTVTDKSQEKTVSPLECVRWSVDKMISKTSPILQALMYSDNLAPDELENLYKIHLYELKTMSYIHNMSIICDNHPDSGKLSVNTASYDVMHFLTSITKQTLKIFDDSNIDISINCDKNCRYASFDVKLLGFIMYNIISNAITHNNRKEKIITINAGCETYREGKRARKVFTVSVKDNGPGVSAAKRKSLFAKESGLVQYDIIEKTGAFMEGGFGLKASYKAVLKMNGDIECLPGKGAEFKISIPQDNDILGFYETNAEAPSFSEFLPIYASALLKIKFNE